MKKIIIILMMLLLVGCTSNNEPSGTVVINDLEPTVVEDTIEETETIVEEETAQKYFLTYNDINIHLTDEAKPIFDALGEPINFFESDSCAFQGKDRVYNYPGVEISTYEIEGVEYILNIMILDDTIETNEGIYIGIEGADMFEAYGEDYSNSLDLYVYQDKETELAFVLVDDKVDYIEYRLIKENVDM